MSVLEIIGLAQAVALTGIWFRLGGVLADIKHHDKRIEKLEEKHA